MMSFAILLHFLYRDILILLAQFLRAVHRKLQANLHLNLTVVLYLIVFGHVMRLNELALLFLLRNNKTILAGIRLF